MQTLSERRDAQRASLFLLGPAVEELKDPVSRLDPSAICAELPGGPAETDPKRWLPVSLEVYGFAGLLCRLRITSWGTMVLERWLASGRELPPCYFDRIEPSARYDDDGPWFCSRTRLRLSISDLFGHIQEDVLACAARIRRAK